MTLKDVKFCLFSIFGLFPNSISAIWYWCQRFVKKFTQIIEDLSERLHCDETLIKTFQKGKFFYFWVVKCPKTRCVVGWHVSEHRTLYDAKFLFWETRRKFPVGYMPKFIRTDKMPAYNFAINKVFSHEVKHEKVISFKHGNNVIENFFRCKRRFPKFRTLQSAGRYLSTWIYDYNTEKLALSIFRICFIIRRLKTIRYGHHRKLYKNYLQQSRIGFCMGTVSYTHLTLPTIYSV